MSLLGWFTGLLGFGSFIGMIAWLVHLGKQIKEAEYDKERVILLETHQKDLKRWFAEVDRLADESNRLKKLVGNADFADTQRVFESAHPANLPTPKKSETAS